MGIRAIAGVLASQITTALGYVPVNKAGDTMTGPLLQSNGTSAAPSYSFSASSGTGVYSSAGGSLLVSIGGSLIWQWNGSDAAILSNSGRLYFGVNSDVSIGRDSANSISQRNGVNAQAFALYNTFTDASNYEVLSFAWTGNVATIQPTAAGTGSSRNLVVKSPNLLILRGGALGLNVYGSALAPESIGGMALGVSGLGFSKIYIDYTNTNTVGAVTINKAAGRVNIAAAQTAITVTNSLCTAAAHVFAVISTADNTAYIKNVVPAAGVFTIMLGASATAQTSIDFFIVNAD